MNKAQQMQLLRISYVLATANFDNAYKRRASQEELDRLVRKQHRIINQALELNNAN